VLANDLSKLVYVEPEPAVDSAEDPNADPIDDPAVEDPALAAADSEELPG
jgi:hypothetical protein